MANWTIRTHYKKSCEQHEHFYNAGADGKIIAKALFRSAEFKIETSNSDFPNFEFTETPGGDGKVDSVDLFNLTGGNIESTELDSMTDGGYSIIKFLDINDKKEEEQLEELIREKGSNALESYENGNWYLSDTECWVWGPLEIEDEAGIVRIICADDDGNLIDFVEEY